MGTREKSSTRSTQLPDAMAGHGPSPGGHGAHPIHIHPARPFYRFAATGRSSDVVLPVLQSETRHASTAWLETPMGALRRDEALQREKVLEDSSGGKLRRLSQLQSITRGGPKILQCKYWEQWRRGACECK